MFFFFKNKESVAIDGQAALIFMDGGGETIEAFRGYNFRPANPIFSREECDNLFGGVFSDLEESSVRAIKQNRLFAVIVTLTLSIS